MLVHSLMIEDPLTISDRTSVQEAIALMQDHSIRHLPVVDDSKKLLGWVTLGDMKQGLLPAMVTGLSVADLMIRNPVTVHPQDDVEVAARLVRSKPPMRSCGGWSSSSGVPRVPPARTSWIESELFRPARSRASPSSSSTETSPPPFN